ncbi:unnamed protein product [Paramecium sonneborni]|uniref:Uncharacterized protein n=1 Tax=Paramecium sonneborni TaxID=65129 RepID=A0A8S1RRZ5_9CILI|nr:unnamed protein product [Paramecium sonneborni]
MLKKLNDRQGKMIQNSRRIRKIPFQSIFLLLKKFKYEVLWNNNQQKGVIQRYRGMNIGVYVEVITPCDCYQRKWYRKQMKPQQFYQEEIKIYQISISTKVLPLKEVNLTGFLQPNFQLLY